MKKIIVIMIAVLAIFSFVACGDDSSSASAVKVSDDMKAFMGEFDGTTAKVKSALDKYAVEGIDTDMADYELKNAKVKASEEKDGGTVYTMSVESGATKRKYIITWKDGKIQTAKYDGFDFE